MLTCTTPKHIDPVCWTCPDCPTQKQKFKMTDLLFDIKRAEERSEKKAFAEYLTIWKAAAAQLKKTGAKEDLDAYEALEFVNPVVKLTFKCCKCKTAEQIETGT